MTVSNKSKYLAIGTFSAAATPKQLDTFMSSEVPATLKLYVEGKMDQFWLRHDGKGVVFIMTTETAEEADALLGALPLGRAGLLHFELIPIGTLTAFSILIGDKFSLAR
jgi:hypothetical protein